MCTHIRKKEEDINGSIPMVQITLPKAFKQHNKALHTNHPFALCGLYGHYSDHCTKLQTFWSTLAGLRQQSLASQVTVIEEVLPPIISTKVTNTIYYVSSSIGSSSMAQPSTTHTILNGCTSPTSLPSSSPSSESDLPDLSWKP